MKASALCGSNKFSSRNCSVGCVEAFSLLPKFWVEILTQVVVVVVVVVMLGRGFWTGAKDGAHYLGAPCFTSQA